MFTSCKGTIISYDTFHTKAMAASENELPYQAFDVSLDEDDPDKEEDIEVSAHYVLKDNEWVSSSDIEDNVKTFIEKHFALQAYEIEQPVGDERYVYYINPLRVEMEIGPLIITTENKEETSFDVYNLSFNEYGYLSYLKYENRKTYVEGRNTTSKIYRITMNITYLGCRMGILGCSTAEMKVSLGC